MQQVRDLTRGLEPIELERGGLMMALQDLAQTTSRAGAVSCSFEYERPLLISNTERAEQLYRIAQEGASNALKHAKASHIVIGLAEHPQGHSLRISDDGQGFPAEVLAGQAPRTIKYRADQLGAILRTSNKDEGAVLEIIF